jgi:hypothetical protein
VDQLALKRAAASRLSGEWNDDDYDVLADGAVVGRVMKAAAAPVGQPWLWTLAYGHRPHADLRLRGDARGRDGCVRQELAANRTCPAIGEAAGALNYTRRLSNRRGGREVAKITFGC